ncbi:hypothetical protein [Micromonospora sp. WMMD712]|uniref:hypothetical protein n=1 Tax=Micromonospora sp. WMMD712 TaxID=3016096 RepID=UPI00249AE4D3|nr:hypothetical protein [Micromonospora sp. WMMD712]WFE58856.1 hypothetical protein O7633_19285 [Micromonospora sp. WMMD712]
MARRGWGGSIATAIGVAAGAGAAQLGFGYGLGIINWSASGVGAGEAAWVASLAWATWISATSTITGAVCAQRLRRPVARGEDPAATGPADAPTDAAPTGDPTATDPTTTDPTTTDDAPTDDPATGDPTIDAGPAAEPDPAAPGPDVADAADRAAGPEPTDPPRPAGAVALALAAAVGALVTVLLVAVPARMAEVPGVAAPQAMAAGYAGMGLFLGLLVAVWALRSPAAAANVIATVGWLWLLAVVAVVDGVLAGRGLTTAQLGIWQLSADRPGFWIRDWFYWPGAALALGSALLIGALAARRAARSVEQRLGAAASGGAGPILVALAYLLVVPGLGTLGREQVSAHLVAPYAVVLGLAGSVLTAALAQRSANRRSARRDRGGPADGPARPTAGGRGSAGPAALPRQRSAAAGEPTATTGEPTATTGEATPTTAPGPARPAGAAADQPA